MPTYVYLCGRGHEWEVVKRIADLDEVEMCATCQTLGDRQIQRANFTQANDWNTQTFNPALGCYTRNTRHARQIAKSRGMEEVGTEPVEKIHAKFERDREDRTAQRWAEADRDKVYE